MRVNERERVQRLGLVGKHGEGCADVCVADNYDDCSDHHFFFSFLIHRGPHPARQTRKLANVYRPELNSVHFVFTPSWHLPSAAGCHHSAHSEQFSGKESINYAQMHGKTSVKYANLCCCCLLSVFKKKKNKYWSALASLILSRRVSVAFNKSVLTWKWSSLSMKSKNLAS